MLLCWNNFIIYLLVFVRLWSVGCKDFVWYSVWISSFLFFFLVGGEDLFPFSLIHIHICYFLFYIYLCSFPVFSSNCFVYVRMYNAFLYYLFMLQKQWSKLLLLKLHVFESMKFGFQYKCRVLVKIKCSRVNLVQYKTLP